VNYPLKQSAEGRIAGVGMRKIFLSAAIAVLCIPFAAMAQQEHPKIEAFGGYSYFRANPEHFNLNGWNAQITGNFNHWFGLTADVAGHYASPSALGSGVNINQYTFTGGPTISHRAGKITPFAHALFGGARAGTDAFGIKSNDWAFAMILGGGIDINIGKSFAIRPIQADYVMTKFGSGEDNRQNNFRYSGGIVFKFGSK
jgi:hypothetical protein